MTAWSYASPLDAVVAALKFRRLDYLGAPLGRAAWSARCGSATDRGLIDPEAVDVVVPVPLHWTRRWYRGFNQASLIAGAIARDLGRPIGHALTRRRRTPPQTTLDRARRLKNPRGGFVVWRRSRSRVAGRRVLLVDDVVTTGATVTAAAQALKRAGAARVLVFAVGRTP